jgi:hypothetical protein
MTVAVEQQPLKHPSELEDVSRFAIFVIAGTLSVTIAFIGYAVRLPEESLLARSVIDEAIWLAKLAFMAAFFEAFRFFGWFDFAKPHRFHRILFIAIYSALLIATVLSVSGIAHEMRAVQTIKATTAYKAQVERYNKCAQQRWDETVEAGARSVTSRIDYAACVQKFTQTPQPLFSTTTAELACKSHKTAERKADRDEAAAKAKSCDHLKPKL